MAPRVWWKNISFQAPSEPVLLKCLIYSVLKEGRKSTNIGLEMGVKIGGYAVKSGKNTHLVVVMCMR